jgi:co-chaperonin GroES (HSP10)
MVATATKSKAIPFEPFGDLVMIKPHPQNSTPGGIALPEGAQLDPPTGTVVKVGPNVGKDVDGARPIQPNDVVYLLFQSYGPPVNMTFGGQQYVLVHENEILGRRV